MFSRFKRWKLGIIPPACVHSNFIYHHWCKLFISGVLFIFAIFFQHFRADCEARLKSGWSFQISANKSAGLYEHRLAAVEWKQSGGLIIQLKTWNQIVAVRTQSSAHRLLPAAPGDICLQTAGKVKAGMIHRWENVSLFTSSGDAVVEKSPHEWNISFISRSAARNRAAGRGCSRHRWSSPAGETRTWSEMNSRHFVTYKNSLHIKYHGRHRLNLGAPNSWSRGEGVPIPTLVRPPCCVRVTSKDSTWPR